MRQRDIQRFVPVLATLLSAFFVAQGCGQLLAARLSVPTEDEAEMRPAGAPGGAMTLGAMAALGAERRDPTQILRRNIFDSTTGPLDGSPAAAGDGGEGGSMGSGCPADLKLVAALVNYRDPDASIAAIASGGKAMPYQVGMSVEGRELVGVQPEEATLRASGGQACTVTMFGDGSSPPPATPAAPGPANMPAVASADGISNIEYDSGIKKISETKYSVSRGLMNKILGNRAALLQTARITPHEESGRVVGVQLVRIRPGTLLSRIGLNRGDVLRTINGYDMASPDSALEAYGKLRTADRLSLALLRDGQPVTMEYEIR